MTKPFSIAFKKKMVEQLTGKDAISQRELARRTGIAQPTASRWVLEARNLPLMARKRNHKTKAWSVDDKVRVLAAASRRGGRGGGGGRGGRGAFTPRTLSLSVNPSGTSFRA